MRYLLDTSHDLAVCAEELGVDSSFVGQLLTPLTRYKRKSDLFAIDNGAFSGFQPALFWSLLNREEGAQAMCLWVACPDVVGSAIRTMELYARFAPEIRRKRWPLALVCQDGMEHFSIPWEELAAVFIGGSSAWKMSEYALHIVRCAQALGKMAHVGRVNTADRLETLIGWGVDSIDGTGISRYTHMRRAITQPHPTLPMVDEQEAK